MPEKFNPNSISPEDFAKQLRKPEGETGKQVGMLMNKSNAHICLNTYKVLHPKKGNHILEIGMGNGFFANDLLKMNSNLRYTGVDFSDVMVKEAKEINKKLIEEGYARFEQASIEQLPFNDNSFDCITTTNTLYFWPQPTENTKELLRVLKPNGNLVIAYRSKSCMEQLPFTKLGFDKYEIQDVENLLLTAGFRDISTQHIAEPALDFDGKILEMEGIYTCGTK